MQLWVRECLRVLREGQRVEALVQKLRKLCPFSLADGAFQASLVSRVLHDPHQAAHPPNRFVTAYFWTNLVDAVRDAAAASGSTSGAAVPVEVHAELLAKAAESKSILDAKDEENVFSRWYRSYEVAAQCDADTTTTLAGPTESVLVLPAADAEQGGCGSRVYPFGVETGCMAASIGLIMWPAGFLLSEFAMDNPHLFRGKRVLELGAGIGLTSVMAATFAQPSAVIATDFDVRALENIHHNFIRNGLLPEDAPFVKPDADSDADANSDSRLEPPTYTSSGVAPAPLSPFPAASAAASTAASSPSSAAPAGATACQVHTARVDWYNYSAAQLRKFDADVIIAADTTYVSEILVPFAQTVRACLEARPDAVVYLAQAERHPSTFLQYLDALRVSGATPNAGTDTHTARRSIQHCARQRPLRSALAHPTPRVRLCAL